MPRVVPVNRFLLVLLLALILAGCAEPEKPPISIASLIEDPALLDTVLARCTAGDEELRATQDCTNARRAGDVVAATAEEEQGIDLEAQFERKRAALRRERERQDLQQEIAEDRAEKEAAAKESEELTGSAAYADELIAEEAEVLPPTTPIGAVMEPKVTEDAPLPGLDETAVCTIEPAALTDADLEMLLIALQEEWQYRRSHGPPARPANRNKLPAQESGSGTQGNQREDDPADVLAGADGG